MIMFIYEILYLVTFPSMFHLGSLVSISVLKFFSKCASFQRSDVSVVSPVIILCRITGFEGIYCLHFLYQSTQYYNPVSSLSSERLRSTCSSIFWILQITFRNICLHFQLQVNKNTFIAYLHSFNSLLILHCCILFVTVSSYIYFIYHRMSLASNINSFVLTICFGQC